jgi:hypothetical protein
VTQPGSGNVNLTRSQSDGLIVDMATAQPFVAAAWRSGEPIIYGLGASAYAARNMALKADAPVDTEICSRVVGELMVWQGPSGRRVTVEDFLTIDN